MARVRVVYDLLKCSYVIRETHPIKLVQSLVSTNVNNNLARNEKIEKKEKKKVRKIRSYLTKEKKKRNKEDIVVYIKNRDIV